MHVRACVQKRKACVVDSKIEMNCIYTDTRRAHTYLKSMMMMRRRIKFKPMYAMYAYWLDVTR